MSYILKEQFANAGNYGGDRTAGEIRYLVIHYTGNNGDTAANNASYFQNNVVKASAHYFVDDTSVYRSVPDLKIAWAVGGKPYADCRETGGGTLYGVVTNRNSISIELCDTIRDNGYKASEATLANAIQLCLELMERYQIPLSHVCRHFDVTGKQCPQYFVNASDWVAFKCRLTDLPVSQEQFNRLMERWLTAQAAESPSSGSQAARQWAETLGLISGFSDGSKRYRSFCTREQLILILHRFWNHLQNKKNEPTSERAGSE